MGCISSSSKLVHEQAITISYWCQYPCTTDVHVCIDVGEEPPEEGQPCLRYISVICDFCCEDGDSTARV